MYKYLITTKDLLNVVFGDDKMLVVVNSIVQVLVNNLVYVLLALGTEHRSIPFGCPGNHHAGSTRFFPKGLDPFVGIARVLSAVPRSAVGYNRYFGMLDNFLYDINVILFIWTLIFSSTMNSKRCNARRFNYLKNQASLEFIIIVKGMSGTHLDQIERFL